MKFSLQENLKIPKGQSEAINRRVTDNTMTSQTERTKIQTIIRCSQE